MDSLNSSIFVIVISKSEVFRNQFNIIMYNKIEKSFYRMKMIAHEFILKMRYFSLNYAVYCSAWWIGWYIPSLRRVCMWGFIHKDKYVKAYLKNKYSDIMTSYASTDKREMKFVHTEDFPIWVFWYQGFKTSPPLVKACLENLKRKNKNVIEISKDNIDSFIDIPEYIKQKVSKGEITYTHYSDIIRVSLLAKYGGLWLDSTCFVSKAIPESIKQKDFYSSKTINKQPLPLWSNSRWCGWGQGTCYKNYPLYIFLRDMLYAYWRTEKILIDYLLLDALMEIGFDINPMMQKDLQDLPENNINRNRLWLLMNEAFQQSKYEELTKQTWLFKLSYKTKLNTTTKLGEETFYYKILTQQLK